MTCASRLIECPHCAATGCRNENCTNLVLSKGKCSRCDQPVKKAKPLRRVCKTTLGDPAAEAPAAATLRTSAAIATAHKFELPPPRPLSRPLRTAPPPPSPPAPVASAARRSSALTGAGLVVLLLAFGGYASQTAFTRVPGPAASSGPVASLFADAGALAIRYERDTARADDLFKGRTVTLSGRLERVGDNYISVHGRAVSIRCGLGRPATAQEKAILPGAAVTLRGSVDGSPEKGRVDLSACRLLAVAE